MSEYFRTRKYDTLQSSLLTVIRASALIRASLLVVLWLATWQIGALVEYTEHASVWFPAAGVTFAAFLIAGRSAFVPLTISAIIITFWAGHHYQLGLSAQELLVAGVAYAIAHLIPYFLCARLVARLTDSAWYSLPQLIVVFLVAAALASMLATILGLTALIHTGMMSSSAFSSTWLPYWIGDLAGVIVLGPLFTALLSGVYPQSEVKLEEFQSVTKDGPTPGFWRKLLTNMVLIVCSMSLAKITGASESAFAIFFLAITHMWIACTESPMFNAISLAISSFMIALLVHLFGLMEHVMVYQFAINVVAANALFGIAVPRLAADNQRLRSMVLTDSLTRAASREHLLQRAELEILHSHSEGTPLALIVFDLDHFKQLNDTYGHTIGDQVLVAACKAIKRVLRPTDILARYGGDEFVILLPATNIAAAQRIAQRILNRVAKVKVREDVLGASIGITALCEGDTYSALFEQADAALYQAKRQGRGRYFTQPRPDEHYVGADANRGAQ